MSSTIAIRKKVKPLFDRVHGWIKTAGVFKKVNQGDVVEILLLSFLYDRHHGKEPFSKEKLQHVKEYYHKIKDEYYDNMIFEEKDLE